MKTRTAFLTATICLLFCCPANAGSLSEWNAAQGLYDSTNENVLSIGPTFHTLLYDSEYHPSVRILMVGAVLSYVHQGITGLYAGVDLEYAAGDHDGNEDGVRFTTDLRTAGAQARIGYRDIYGERIAVTPHIGLGYRWMDQEMEEKAGAALMDATHDLVFASVGVNIAPPAEYSHGWAWTARAEARIGLSGSTDARMPRVVTYPTKYEADYGLADRYGLKADIGVRKKVHSAVAVRGDVFGSWWRAREVDADFLQFGTWVPGRIAAFDEFTYGILISVEFLAF
ncbi:MAG: autotransporter outer membrane beta-barrel domain-containing protein [Desulfomonilia bacterium]|jgi:hypothetical protein